MPPKFKHYLVNGVGVCPSCTRVHDKHSTTLRPKWHQGCGCVSPELVLTYKVERYLDLDVNCVMEVVVNYKPVYLIIPKRNRYIGGHNHPEKEPIDANPPRKSREVFDDSGPESYDPMLFSAFDQELGYHFPFDLGDDPLWREWLDYKRELFRTSAG